MIKVKIIDVDKNCVLEEILFAHDTQTIEAINEIKNLLIILQMVK